MNAMSLDARKFIRVLSPRMLPPPFGLVGSTERTATRCPKSVTIWRPRASMRVLLPAPGTPVIPIRTESFSGKRQFSATWSAKSRSLGRELSINVIAFARIVRFPARIPSAYSAADKHVPGEWPRLDPLACGLSAAARLVRLSRDFNDLLPQALCARSPVSSVGPRGE